MELIDSRDSVDMYLPLLLEGNPERVQALFAGEPVIDDPRGGRIAGREATARFVEATFTWLRARDASVEPVRATREGGRSVVESVLHLVQAGRKIPLPVALVGELAEGGKLRELRVYHSHWPLIGGHQVRPPLLAEDPHLVVPDVIDRYQRALAEGDLEGMLAVFEPDGYAREPSGGEYVYRGPEGLRHFYGGLFTEGGVTLEHCTLTDDGVCCAIEYNAVGLGDKQIAPQAGVAAYERGPSGLLQAARIYDDVAVEEETSAG